MTLREQLLEMAEPRYRDFTMSLMPGVANVIGIRIPLLRKIAREIARGDWQAFVTDPDKLYFEERMLEGLVIGYARCGIEEKLAHIGHFVPKIDNWAVCDSHSMRRIPRAERQRMWEFIQPYFASEAEYDVRFAVVTGLTNFVDEEHVGPLLDRLDAMRHEAYYTRMSVAWAVSVCFVKFPALTLEWLRGCTLDDWTFNKSLQKIVESYRVDDAMKTVIRGMKRRTK